MERNIGGDETLTTVSGVQKNLYNKRLKKLHLSTVTEANFEIHRSRNNEECHNSIVRFG